MLAFLKSVSIYFQFYEQSVTFCFDNNFQKHVNIILYLSILILVILAKYVAKHALVTKFQNVLHL